MANATVVHLMVTNVDSESFVNPPYIEFVNGSTGEQTPPTKNRSLRLAAWKRLGKLYKWKGFQAIQPNLSNSQGE